MWTGSQIVLSWIRSTKLLPPFVMRRINQIKQNKGVEFRYVNTQDNPADVATRLDNIRNMELWSEGPEFLKKEEKYWPKMIQYENINKTLLIGEGLEIPENNKEIQEQAENIEEQRPDVRYETQKVREGLNETEEDEKVRKVQQEYYSKEVAGERTSLAASLDLFKDEKGILRCRGRLSRAMWQYEKKYPILLPRNCEFTDKLIEKIHNKNYHVGVSHTLSLVRESYWIPKGRAQVQKVLKRCYQCIKHGGGPYKLPFMPPLPPERVSYSRAFSYVGLDYLGPLKTQTDDGTQTKRWICLFTCLAVRAVHLELVKDLTTEEFLLAFRRMVAARGCPLMVTSDNATNFKLSADVLTGPYCIENKIIWKFIPELAPWHGGFYERLIALVKHCLKRTLDKHLLDDSKLHTVIKEIETILNTRPLTYVGSEPEHILRPINFLSLGNCIGVSSEVPYFNEESEVKKIIIESWKRGQNIISEFIKMFTNQYLTELRNRKQVKHKQNRVVSNKIPEIGDIVQLRGESGNRTLWKTGKIVSIVKGKDGEIRVARVQVENKLFTRSVGHLYPLELESEEESEVIRGKQEKDNTSGKLVQDNNRVNNNDSESIANVRDVRVPRISAERARKKIEIWTKQLFNM